MGTATFCVDVVKLVLEPEAGATAVVEVEACAGVVDDVLVVDAAGAPKEKPDLAGAGAGAAAAG